MIQHYFKQAWFLMKQNPLISTLSVAGTALAISAVMLCVLIVQVQVISYAPESSRDRMLVVAATHVEEKENPGNWNNGMMGLRVVRELFYQLKTPQEVCGKLELAVTVSSSQKRSFRQHIAQYTDERFWNIFDFTFLEGTPYDSVDCESGLKKAVISSKLAFRLFGSERACGQTVIVNQTPYQVCGVVKEVSKAARFAYADVWMPYQSLPQVDSFFNMYEGLVGPFGIVMMMKDAGDYETVRTEMLQAADRMNASLERYNISFFQAPYRNIDLVMTGYDTWVDKIDAAGWMLKRGSLILLLLILPALNMVGISLTSFRKRKAEIGIRKAFGATPRHIYRQVLYESSLISLAGGLLGLLLSFPLLLMTQEIFFPQDTVFSTQMLLQPVTFLITLLFVFLLNLLCAGLPAWKAGRYNIVQSLNNHE